MRKLGIAAVILLILGALVAFALLNLDRLVNRNKDYILTQAEQALGRKVAVEAIGVTVWGGIGVRLKNFAMADDRAFSQKDFLRAADLQVNVELLPLLRKELRIKRLILHEPVIRVIRNTKGTLNFATLGRPRQDRAKQTAPSTAPPAATAAFPLLVSRVKVTDGEIHYLDRKDRVDLRVRQIDLTVEDLGFDRPISINLAAAVNADRQNVKIDGKIGPLPPTHGLRNLKDLPLSGDITLGPLTLADLKHIAPLSAVLPKDFKANGPLSLNTHVDGSLKDLALKGTLDATGSAIRFGDRFRKPKGVPLLLSTDARVTRTRITLHKASMTLHTLKLNGSGTVTRGKTPALRITVDSGRTDLAGWEKILPFLQGYKLAGTMEVHARIQGKMKKGRIPDIKGSAKLTGLRATLPQVPQPLAAQSATVTFTGQRAALKDTSVMLGKSRMRLTAQVERFTPLAVTYRLSAPELWVADLVGGAQAKKKREVLREVKSNGRVSTTKGALSYWGQVSSARGRIADVDYTNLKASISMADQVVTIKDLRLRAYKGSLQGQGRYDLRKTPPRFTFTSQVRRMDLSAFFRSASAAKHIRGGLNLDMTLSARGKRWEDIKRALSGQGKAEVLDGALLDVNIAEGALAGLTGVPGFSLFISPKTRKKYPAIFATQNTEFGQLKGSMNIRNGKIYLEDLLVAAADWAFRGKGWLTFDQRLALQARLVLSQQLSTDLIQDVKALKYLADRAGRVVLPFALTGTLPRVKPVPDLAYVAGRLLTRKLFRQPSAPPQEAPKEEQKSTSPPPTEEPAQPEKTSPEEQFRKELERIFRR
ncbi:MAG: AsmA family protein [candidate division NC10 bacterium]